MKKQILNISLLLVSSSMILAIWALPQQGKDEEGTYVRDYKEEVLVEEEEKKDSVQNNRTDGKEKKNDSAKNSDTVYVSKKQEQSASESKKPQTKAKTRLVKKTVVKTDTIGDDIKIKDVNLRYYGRGLEFRKVSKKHTDVEPVALPVDSAL